MKNQFSKTRQTLAVLLSIVMSFCVVVPTAVAQGPSSFPPTWVFARAYAGWNILGQQANTYTFNGGACNYSPYNNGSTSAFFVFSGTVSGTTVYYPTAIIDVTPSLSEIVTPTSTTQTASTCGFAASTVNAHTSFNLVSGTVGLQEAIANSPAGTPTFNVILDKYWYQQVAALPGAPTGASIIAKVTGNANVSILDTTVVPWAQYIWNGTQYVPDSFSGSPSFTSVTPVSAPNALSTGAASAGLITTATTGGSIPASSTYRLGATYVTALGGETTLSTDTASTSTIASGATATNTITVTSPAAATGAVGWRVYMSAAGGASLSEILYVSSCVSASTGQTVLNGVCAIGSNAVITAVLTGTATVPTVSSSFLIPAGSYSPLQSVPVSYPPFTALGTVATTVVGNLGLINLPTGFLNSLGRTVRMCGTGYGTTNGTGGTLTFATKLASIPGVTAVTPFTVASPAIAASVLTVNYTFCETWTTQATGATGTVEAHGTVAYNVAGTAVTSPAQDNVIAVSSTVDLTKQDQVEFTITPTTAGLTVGQLRQLTFEVLQ